MKTIKYGSVVLIAAGLALAGCGKGKGKSSSSEGETPAGPEQKKEEEKKEEEKKKEEGAALTDIAFSGSLAVPAGTVGVGGLSLLVSEPEFKIYLVSFTDDAKSWVVEVDETGKFSKTIDAANHMIGFFIRQLKNGKYVTIANGEFGGASSGSDEDMAAFGAGTLTIDIVVDKDGRAVAKIDTSKSTAASPEARQAALVKIKEKAGASALAESVNFTGTWESRCVADGQDLGACYTFSAAGESSYFHEFVNKAGEKKIAIWENKAAFSACVDPAAAAGVQGSEENPNFGIKYRGTVVPFNLTSADAYRKSMDGLYSRIKSEDASFVTDIHGVVDSSQKYLKEMCAHQPSEENCALIAQENDEYGYPIWKDYTTADIAAAQVNPPSGTIEKQTFACSNDYKSKFNEDGSYKEDALPWCPHFVSVADGASGSYDEYFVVSGSSRSRLNLVCSRGDWVSVDGAQATTLAGAVAALGQSNPDCQDAGTPFAAGVKRAEANAIRDILGRVFSVKEEERQWMCPKVTLPANAAACRDVVYRYNPDYKVYDGPGGDGAFPEDKPELALQDEAKPTADSSVAGAAAYDQGLNQFCYEFDSTLQAFGKMIDENGAIVADTLSGENNYYYVNAYSHGALCPNAKAAYDTAMANPPERTGNETPEQDVQFSSYYETAETNFRNACGTEFTGKSFTDMAALIQARTEAFKDPVTSLICDMTGDRLADQIEASKSSCAANVYVGWDWDPSSNTSRESLQCYGSEGNKCVADDGRILAHTPGRVGYLDKEELAPGYVNISQKQSYDYYGWDPENRQGQECHSNYLTVLKGKTPDANTLIGIYDFKFDNVCTVVEDVKDAIDQKEEAPVPAGAAPDEPEKPELALQDMPKPDDGLGGDGLGGDGEGGEPEKEPAKEVEGSGAVKPSVTGLQIKLIRIGD